MFVFDVPPVRAALVLSVEDTLFRSKTDLRPNSQKVTTVYKLDGSR